MKHFVCDRSELEERKLYHVSIEGLEIGVVLVKGEVHAIENNCPHFEGPVCLGDVSGRVRTLLDENMCSRGNYANEDEVNIVCPWHGFEFDIKSGDCIADSKFKLRKFTTSIEDGKVYLSF